MKIKLRSYACILADPPWHFKTHSVPTPADFAKNASDRTRHAAEHYTTMTQAGIYALPVGELAAKDCVLCMWAIDSMIPEALETGRRWGFKYKTVAFYWAKSGKGDPSTFPMGTGYWTRANPEPCLLFTRGHPKRLDAGVPKLILAPRREHSRKPDETYTRIERLVSGPRIELFARHRRRGWASWGNQADKFTES